MSFLLLKGLHITCAPKSYTLLLLRGIWSLRDPPIMKLRRVRIVPHVVDTLPLASAMALMEQCRSAAPTFLMLQLIGGEI